MTVTATATVADRKIVQTYLRNSKGIRGTARVLGISVVRAGKVILAYKKRHGLR
jgi:hypothetical protein